MAGTAVATWQAIRATRAEGVAITERDEKEAARHEALVSADQARAAAESEVQQRKLAEAAARAERQAKEAEAQQRQQAEAAEKQASEEAGVAKAVNELPAARPARTCRCQSSDSKPRMRRPDARR